MSVVVLLGAVAESSAGRVDVASTGNNSELEDTIPITKPGKTEPKVVMSLGGKRLPELQADDELRATAELEVTTDCLEGGVEGCQGEPYDDFDPEVRARLILAGTDTATRGKKLGQERITCKQRLPNRQHHCVIVFNPKDDYTIQEADPKQRVNLVVEAFDERARRGTELVIGAANAHDPEVQKDKGRINVVRRRDAVSAMELPPASKPGPDRLEIPDGKGDSSSHLVYARKLPDRLRKKGAQLDVEALVKTSHKLEQNVRIGSHVFLSKGSRGPHFHGKQFEGVAAWRGEISEHNGSNCTRERTTCKRTRKVGVMRLKENVAEELWVNVVIVTQPLQANPPNDAKVRVYANEGHLRVTGYPPEAAAPERPRPPGPPGAPTPPRRAPEAVTTDPEPGGSCREKTLRGLVDPRGWETSYRFIWRRIDGETTHYGPWRPAGASTSRMQVSEHVGGLVPKRDYEVKLVAESAAGRGEGDWRRFSTASC